MVRGVPWLGRRACERHCGGAYGGGTAGADPRAGADLSRCGIREPGVRSRRDARPGLGPRVRRGRAPASRRLLARLLAHDRTLRQAIRARVREGGRRAPRTPLQLRLLGESARRLGADVEEARRAPAATGRRGDHRRGRFSDDGQPDRPQPARACLRGRRARHLQPGRVAARGSRRPADTGRSSPRTRSATRSRSTRCSRSRRSTTCG